MTNLAAQALFEAAYQQLGASSTLGAKITGIYSHVPEGAVVPYITLGLGTMNDWSSKSFTGQEHLFDVHIWSGDPGGKEVRDITDILHETLQAADLTLEGHKLISLNFTFFENFFDVNGDVTHGILRFRARTVKT